MKLSSKLLPIMLLISSPALRLAAMDNSIDYNASALAKPQTIWVKDTEFNGPTKKNAKTHWVLKEVVSNIMESKLEESVMNGAIEQQDADALKASIVDATSKSELVGQDLKLKNISMIALLTAADDAAKLELTLLENPTRKSKYDASFAKLATKLNDTRKTNLKNTPAQKADELKLNELIKKEEEAAAAKKKREDHIAELKARIAEYEEAISSLKPAQTKVETAETPKQETAAVTLTLWQRIFGK